MDGKNEMGEWKRTTEQKFSQPDANMVNMSEKAENPLNDIKNVEVEPVKVPEFNVL
ncbi:unnamed protein product [Brugia timori]|uniref:Conserved domain protein n=1 Tax=Brugia timori TaxID=42155 RepID=A0A0R3QF59_9BILA|nr:unnamed protein product [Brugia timori]